MEVKSPSGKVYLVGAELGRTERFDLFHCQTEEMPKCGIIKIAPTVAENGILDREAFLLREMSKTAVELEAAYAKVKTSSSTLNYQFFFPNLVESFVWEEEGGRRINILNFSHIAKELFDLVPIGHIASRDRFRVDPRTSAWMLGKLLKLLSFAHEQGIAVNALTGDNILINKDQHYVSVFDWTLATVEDGGLTQDMVSQEIRSATEEVILALGGNPETGEIPADEQLIDGRYEELLKSLIHGSKESAYMTHEKFYEIVWSIWPRGFHPYSTYMRS